ncbi:MAG: class I adenylate-forming enzyme family protein, partial [Pseudomonadota bacterium]
MKISPAAPPEGTVRDWLDARAASGGTAVVFPETGQELSWAALRADAVAIAGDLAARGLAKGESVAVVHPNGAAGLTAIYAAMYGGFRATMINLAAGPDAIAYALEHSQAGIAFVHDDQLEMFNAVCPSGVEVYAPKGGVAPLCELSAQDDALLMYTSGTTGRPKGVVHVHSSLLAGGWTASVAHELGPQDRGLCVLPIYHINGLCVSVMGALVSGGS